MGKNQAIFDRAARIFRSAFAGAFLQTSNRTLSLLSYRLDESSQRVTSHFAAISGGINTPTHRDELQYKDLSWYEFDTEAEPQAEAIKFRRTDFNEDRFGDHASVGARMATRVKSAQRRQAVTKLVGGFTSDIGVIDGENFFSASHETEDGTYSNIQSGALAESTFDAGYAKLLGMPTLDGDQLYEQVDGELDVMLLVGPEKKSVADDIVKATIDGGDVNPRANRAIVHTLADLRAGGPLDAYKNYWFLLLANLGIAGGEEHKPIYLLEPEAPEIDFRLDPTDPRAWDRDEYEVKIRHNSGFGFGAPWVIVGSTGT
jgi:hypothetical protein